MASDAISATPVTSGLRIIDREYGRLLARARALLDADGPDLLEAHWLIDELDQLISSTRRTLDELDRTL